MRSKRKKVTVKVSAIEEKYRPEFKVDQKFSNCMDLRAYIPETRQNQARTIEIWPGEVVTIRTGVKLQLPEGYEAVVRPRSGLAKEYGITIVNSPGTIDTGYTGEILLIVTNHRHTIQGWGGPDKNRKPYVVTDGDRIAQLGIREVPLVNLEFVDEVSEEEEGRGDKGFGSTGK